MNDPIELDFNPAELLTWLGRQGGTHTLLPRWLGSDLLAIVAVVCTDMRDPDAIRFYAVPSKAALQALVAGKGETDRILFYHIPRTPLVVLCPELDGVEFEAADRPDG